MANIAIDVMWDDNPVDVTAEANFIWSIANKLRGSYMPDKYGDVIIPMTIIRRFECALLDDEAKRKDVIETFKQNPNYPEKALFRKSGFQFYNTSDYTLQELCNDADHVAANFKAYIAGFSANVQDILKELEMEQNQDFFTLLLQNDEIKHEVLGLFLSDTYHSLRNGEDVGSGIVYQYEYTTPMMVAEKPVDYGTKEE